MNYSQYDIIASKYDTLFRDEMSLVHVAFGIEWFFLEAGGEGSDATH